MKIKNIYKFLFVALLALQLSGCDNNTDADPKFDQTPTERLNARMAELKAALLSSPEGWKAIYFTDNTILGGYTHFFKFAADGTVEMSSDFDEDTDTYKSEYQIQLGSTVSLVFTTKNRIHLLSESDNYPIDELEAKGYLGDFQFLYYGQENGQIIFKANRNGQEIRFVKATKEDRDNLPKNFDTEANVIGSDSRPLFRLLETNDGTTKHQFDFSFSPVTRYAAANSIETGYSVSFNFGVGYTPTGIEVNPAVEVGGQKLSTFVYNDADGSFTATGTNGVSATIKYSAKPLLLTDDYKLLLPPSGNNVYAYIYNLTKPEPANSPLFLSLLANAEAAAGTGLLIQRIQPWFNNADGTNYIEYRFAAVSNPTVVVARRYHYFTITGDAVNKTVTLTPGVWKATATAAAPAIATPTFLKALDDEFMNPQGLYFAKTPVSGYTAYTFTSTTTPFRMVAYSFQ
ncbi:DUF4302 domain-containing protein [Flavobacterium sp. ANB]|uniref:DUF4302 domain-containing protein n=1 Tax=unclassified Flavobacterium TaxID=196869 RepID=UPI0012B7E435|nr:MULTISPECIES: DUF4302 domain-containing protein [unclassified Flavobacterium]MBF4515701.1 DUF4302 domain-containing protein [Flavobacterium sp. ANB]MTD68704.1 DUF4302 domain-containing protein [Flavobacterium sp. LC2016-13]